MNRTALIIADVSVILFGLLLLVGGLPAMIFGAVLAKQIAGNTGANLWQLLCLLCQVAGAVCAYVAIRNLETR